MRVEITTPATDAPLQFALSPDGRSLVFVASGDGPSRLWLRPLDQTEARPLAGTEGATQPFWSPDGRSIGFFAATALSRLDIAGGAPQVLATVAGNRDGGSWNADGTILYTPAVTSPLWRIAAAGGEPTAVTQLEPPGQTAHRYPHFLPDGRHLSVLRAGDARHRGDLPGVARRRRPGAVDDRRLWGPSSCRQTGWSSCRPERWCRAGWISSAER